MFTLPEISPIAFHLGPWPVRWYGLTYLAGFLAFLGLGRLRAKQPGSGWQVREIDDLLFYGAIGVILGGRLGYVLFYDFANMVHNPWNIFKIWQGGMAFHGGLLGVLVATWMFARASGRSLFHVTDFVVPMIPVGLGFGRLGNFVNRELWGKTTDVPWGMVFPGGGPLPRHPSQLYQAVLEGLVLFSILWFFSRRRRPVMAVSGLFLLGYGVFRFLVEFVRLPDEHLGYLLFDWVTMGQILSTPMIALGALCLFLAYRKREFAPLEGAAQPNSAAVVPKRNKRGKRKRARR